MKIESAVLCAITCAAVESLWPIEPLFSFLGTRLSKLTWRESRLEGSQKDEMIPGPQVQPPLKGHT